MNCKKVVILILSIILGVVSIFATSITFQLTEVESKMPDPTDTPWMFDIDDPGLSNVAATILNLLGFEKPDIYRESLIRFD